MNEQELYNRIVDLELQVIRLKDALREFVDGFIEVDSVVSDLDCDRAMRLLDDLDGE